MTGGKKSSSRSTTRPVRKKAAPKILERDVPPSEGLCFVSIVEAASAANRKAKRLNPGIDVVDLPDIFFMIAGPQPTAEVPFRISVPDLGAVIVDVQLATLATEGENARDALMAKPELRTRAERYAARITGAMAWTWAPARVDPPLTEAMKKFIEWGVKATIDRLLNERIEKLRASPADDNAPVPPGPGAGPADGGAAPRPRRRRRTT